MADKKYENVEIQRDGAITFIMLNRPDKRNAMSPGLHADMCDALSTIATDEQTRVVVIGGNGPAWCAGQDLKLYFREAGKDPIKRRKAGADSHRWRWELLSKYPKPTIAMVHGFAFGGAFTQLCACDYAIVAEDATFGLSEVNWGIIPGGIVSWNLSDMMMPRQALYYATTGATFDGKRAVELGLANFAVPADKLREETMKLAATLSRLNPNVVRYTKEAVRAVRHMTPEMAQDYLAVKQDSLARMDKEIGDRVGMTEFLDKKSYRPGLGPYKR